MAHTEYTLDDFGRAPLMFYYEVTQACVGTAKSAAAAVHGLTP